jgi:peptidyl-prolyl cis-trans isomerase B (cyclophilin B)
VSGKQSKKERKAAQEAQREALRKKERQRTIFTLIVVVVVVAIGGVLVYVSLEDPVSDDIADLLASEDPDATATPGDDVPLAERPIACGAQEPAGAGEAKETYDAPEQVLVDGTDYGATIETSCGTVVVDLDEENTPEAVNSFVFLAEQGFFDGQLIFRNATTIGALQTGAGDDDAGWQVGYTLTDELATATEQGYPAGTMAMANSGPDSAGSQFFLVYDGSFQEAIEAGTGLEPVYTRFGEVLEGLDVLEEIGAIAATGERGETPTERVYLESVTITTG